MNRWLGIALLFVSCSVFAAEGERVSLGDLAASNQSKLIRLSIGMTKDDVLALMGTNTSKTHDGVVNNPWTSESFTDKGGVQTEVWYYVTRKNQPFTPVRRSLTTPVVFKNGKVVGWGNDALSHAY
jgi:outer membrane protein assembly factor BamE (lipoprotein component of BamABCDE complex)